MCVVIDGLAGNKSPNIGKFVTITNRVYGDHGLDHRVYGPMYTCIGQNLTILADDGAYVQVTKADFAGIWLKRIDPPKRQESITAEQRLTEKA